jgi:adenylate kinase family enzyme
MLHLDRILIIGNSGSGKTWLGHALAQRKQLPLFHMDHIRWDQRGYEMRRSAEDIEKDLEAIKRKETWILEGVFGKMAQSCLPFTTFLIWLDLPWEDCKKNLLFRGPQFEDHLISSARDKALKTLMEWAATHETRNDANSWGFFNELYTQFQNTKKCLQSREEVEDFLKGLPV